MFPSLLTPSFTSAAKIETSQFNCNANKLTGFYIIHKNGEKMKRHEHIELTRNKY